jgi:tetratricopeptide (TPR) repeat protein
MDTYERDFSDSLEMARALLSGNDDASDLWEANELVNRALGMRPDDTQAWILKCQILSALDDDFAALAAAEMAVRRKPRNPEAHYWRAAVLADLERYDEALTAIDRAFRHISARTEWLLEDLYYEKAAMLHARGDHSAAVAAYETGLERCPTSSLLKSGLEPLHRERMRRSFKVIEGGLS